MLLILLVTSFGYAQIALNNSPKIATCNLNSANVTVSVPTEILTGDNIALNITLPGSYDAGCVKTVSITNSSNIVFQSSGAIPFTNSGVDTYQNAPSPVLQGNDGHNFNVFYKFPNYVTCNGAVGTFNVTVTLDCAGVITTCTSTVTVIARAANYWTITKEFITGDLTCGISKWRIKLNHNNPNGAGLGTYNLTGTIIETPTVPIVSGASFSVNNSWPFNSHSNYDVYLQNCGNEGTTITNTANYNFTLGDGTCGNMSGTVTDTSTPLVSPNASISFTKSIPSTYFTNYSPGCQSYYVLNICNNGNVPWTDLTMTDNLNIPGISITSMSLSGWTVSPVVPPYPAATYTFTRPGFVLNPGECTSVFIFYEIDAGATVGSTISNAATLSYVAAGTGGGVGGPVTSSCPSIICPTIDSAVQNTTASVDFVVENPKAIPSIKKCILDPPNILNPPIYQIGDTIKFSVMVGNSGSGNLSDVLNDAMGMPGQNLQINPGSITYDYYANENNSYRNSCSPPFGAPIAPPFSVVANTSDLQNPFWTISGMPGICDYNRANFLIITFEAEILPQLSGTKTNTATIPYGPSLVSSSVNYSIDQVGVLGIFKKADTEIVENGQSFNYIITVSNNGSVPLKDLIVTDMLPDCVSINAPITIVDASATAIPFTTSGGLVITINPTAQILPGNDFTITIPVIKNVSGNCCNESVAVTANMVTSGVQLNANYGSVQAPAACVTGSECCDIEDFEASIKESNGAFNVVINGGAVPLQEIEISMVDYHINYSNAQCKPDDLGVFGTLTTTSTNLGSLILNASDNGTSNLSWLLGNPSVINGSVNLDVLYPEVLNLDCCEVDFYFCIKVKVKDVNCNVCEKTICYSSNTQTEPEPCNIKLKPWNNDQKLCIGESVNLNWTSSGTSGTVNISLFDNTNGVEYSVLASGIPNTGSFTYTIPNSIPCSPPRTWSIIVQDSEKECLDKSPIFRIECCEQTTCNCGEWIGNTVGIKAYIKQIPHDPKFKIAFPENWGNKVACGKSISLKPLYNYVFTAPTYMCNPKDCEVTYKWEVIDGNGLVVSSTGQTFNYNFSNYGSYKVVFTPICGGNRCEPCVIYINIDKPGTVFDHFEETVSQPTRKL